MNDNVEQLRDENTESESGLKNKEAKVEDVEYMFSVLPNRPFPASIEPADPFFKFIAHPPGKVRHMPFIVTPTIELPIVKLPKAQTLMGYIDIAAHIVGSHHLNDAFEQTYGKERDGLESVANILGMECQNRFH